MTFSQAAANALDPLALQQVLWRYLPTFAKDRECWMLIRKESRWEPFLQDRTRGGVGLRGNGRGRDGGRWIDTHDVASCQPATRLPHRVGGFSQIRAAVSRRSGSIGQASRARFSSDSPTGSRS